VNDSHNAATVVQRRLLLWLWLIATVGATAWTLFWLFCFVNGIVHGLTGVGRSITILLLAGVGMLLARRAFAAFRKTKESRATS